MTALPTPAVLGTILTTDCRICAMRAELQAEYLFSLLRVVDWKSHRDQGLLLYCTTDTRTYGFAGRHPRHAFVLNDVHHPSSNENLDCRANSTGKSCRKKVLPYDTHPKTYLNSLYTSFTQPNTWATRSKLESTIHGIFVRLKM